MLTVVSQAFLLLGGHCHHRSVDRTLLASRKSLRDTSPPPPFSTPRQETLPVLPSFWRAFGTFFALIFDPLFLLPTPTALFRPISLSSMPLLASPARDSR